MKNKIIIRGLVFGIIILFTGTTVFYTTGLDVKENALKISFQQDIVYVNDEYNESTPGYGIVNFSKIQDGADHVNEGGIVFVHNGTYNEHVVINKSLFLRGITEDPLWGNDANGSIIDGSSNGDVVRITEDDIEITNFTIRKSGASFDESGINIINASRCIISRNYLLDNGNGIKHSGPSPRIEYNTIASSQYDGIFIFGDKLTIYNNNIYSSGLANFEPHGHGIEITYYSTNIRVYNNIINDSFDTGIYLDVNTNVLIHNNSISYCNHWGVILDRTTNVTCTENEIFKNGFGTHLFGAGLSIFLYNHTGAIIQHNNITDNHINIRIVNSIIKKDEFRDNNILNPSCRQIIATGPTFVMAQHNWWGNEDWGPWGKMIRLCIVIVFPWSDKLSE